MAVLPGSLPGGIEVDVHLRFIERKPSGLVGVDDFGASGKNLGMDFRQMPMIFENSRSFGFTGLSHRFKQEPCRAESPHGILV